MGIQEDIHELKELIKSERLEKSEKKWKFPFGKKVGRSQRKRNFVTILLIKENGSYDFKKYKIEDQTIIHELIPRLATANYCVFDKKGNPMIILPEWSVEPFNPKDHLISSLSNGSNVNGYKILMARMLSEGVKTKGLGGWGKWLGIGLGIIVLGIIGYAIFTGGGK